MYDRVWFCAPKRRLLSAAALNARPFTLIPCPLKPEGVMKSGNFQALWHSPGALLPLQDATASIQLGQDTPGTTGVLQGFPHVTQAYLGDNAHFNTTRSTNLQHCHAPSHAANHAAAVPKIPCKVGSLAKPHGPMPLADPQRITAGLSPFPQTTSATNAFPYTAWAVRPVRSPPSLFTSTIQSLCPGFPMFISQFHKSMFIPPCLSPNFQGERKMQKDR